MDRVLKRPLKVGDKEFELVSLSCATSPGYIAKEDYYPGHIVANENELAMFFEKFKPSSWMQIHGVNSTDIIKSMFGPIAKVFKTNGLKVEGVQVNLFHGLPAGTIILFVKNKG